jgi:hypothetical protein
MRVGAGIAGDLDAGQATVREVPADIWGGVVEVCDLTDRQESAADIEGDQGRVLAGGHVALHQGLPLKGTRPFRAGGN